MREIKFDFVYKGDHGFHHKKYYISEFIHKSLERLSDFHCQMELIAIRQFTGLLDKNGVEIYDCDIVKCLSLSNDHSQKGATSLMIVKFFMGSFCFCFKDADSGVPIYPLCVSLQMEVIGNIHEHPHLIDSK